MTASLAPSESDPAFDRRAWVTPEDLNLAPELLGQPLATPRQRGAAMAIDVALLSLLNGLLNVLLVLSLGLSLWLWLRWQRPDLFSRQGLGLRRKAGAEAEPRPSSRLGRPPRLTTCVLVGALGVLGVMEAVDEFRAGAKPAETVASEASEDEVAEAVVEAAVKPLAQGTAASDVAAAVAAATVAAKTAAQAPAASGAATAASATEHEAESREKKQSRRIRQLEAELERAKAPRSLALMEEYRYWRDKFGFLLLPALYFTLLPALWPGQTLGKRLLGLRVLELTGKRLTPLILFKRYGGYAAGMATGFTGFLQLIWDPNRQAIQDKTAHTVVIDTRRPARSFLPAAPIEAEPIATEPATGLDVPKDRS